MLKATALALLLATPATAAELCTNPSFEMNILGWSSYHGSALFRIAAPAKDGFHVAEITGPSSISDFGIDDSPGWARNTVAGRRYYFSAWVRSDSSRSRIDLQLREYNGGIKVGATMIASPLNLGTSWQQLRGEFLAQRDGSLIDFQVRCTPAIQRERFQMDAISVDDSIPIPPPPPPPLRAMSFTMPGQVTDGVSCEGYTPMLSDSCNAHFTWRGPLVNGWGPIRGGAKIRGRKLQRYWLPMPTTAGTYILSYVTSGIGGQNPCIKTMLVSVPPPAAIQDLKVEPK